MSRRGSLAAALGLAACAALALATSGCGVKIAIPHAEGLFSVSAWLDDEQFADADARQITQALGGLFVVAADSLVKRDLEYRQIAGVGGLVDATALCVDPAGQVVFVWDDGTRELKWYSVSDLTALGSASLPHVGSARAIAADSAGIDQVPGARTFVYLADPDSAVVHRYAFDDFNGPTAHGILTRAEGIGARSVHEAWGMATDAGGRMLVCDADTLRNWVVRFDATPDLEDTGPAGQPAPMRGTAATFEVTCEPPAATDFVLGDAAICGQTDWVGGPSSEPGLFRAPTAVSVDGSGRIFVADTGNNRISVFTVDGHYLLQFGDPNSCPSPSSLALVDIRVGTGADDVDYAAYVFIVTPGTGQVRRFISSEHYIYIHREPPPVIP